MKDGLAAFQEAGNKLKQEVEAEKAIVEEQRTQVLASLESLRGLAGIGMSHVDKADIRPPQILVVQKSSNLDEMVDINGKKPSFGQFFNTGSREIMDEFDCYVILAKKGVWTDRRKPEEGQKEMYTMIGVMQGSMRIFGMMLRRSSRYALNNLFSVAIDQKYPMFAFNVHVEVKKLSNADGEWVVPVFRVGQLEQDAEVLGQLMNIAKQFDQQADKIDLTEDVEAEPQDDSVYASDGEDTPF